MQSSNQQGEISIAGGWPCDVGGGYDENQGGAETGGLDRKVHAEEVDDTGGDYEAEWIGRLVPCVATGADAVDREEEYKRVSDRWTFTASNT